MRLVLDTNVLVAAFRSPRGASARLLEAARHGRVTLIANVALFCEWEAVLLRTQHLAAARRGRREMHAALDELAALLQPADRKFSWRPQLRDPDDEMVLEAAIGGRAEAIVTFEEATFAGPAGRFGVQVLTPAQAWAILKP